MTTGRINQISIGAVGAEGELLRCAGDFWSPQRARLSLRPWRRVIDDRVLLLLLLCFLDKQEYSQKSCEGFPFAGSSVHKLLTSFSRLKFLEMRHFSSTDFFSTKFRAGKSVQKNEQKSQRTRKRSGRNAGGTGPPFFFKGGRLRLRRWCLRVRLRRCVLRWVLLFVGHTGAASTQRSDLPSEERLGFFGFFR